MSASSNHGLLLSTLRKVVSFLKGSASTERFSPEFIEALLSFCHAVLQSADGVVAFGTAGVIPCLTPVVGIPGDDIAKVVFPLSSALYAD